MLDSVGSLGWDPLHDRVWGVWGVWALVPVVPGASGPCAPSACALTPIITTSRHPPHEFPFPEHIYRNARASTLRQAPPPAAALPRASAAAAEVAQSPALGEPTTALDWDNLGFGLKGIAPVRIGA